MSLTFNTLIADVSVALKAINYYQAGRFNEAISHLQDILDYEPNNWDARIMLGACLYKTNKFAAAERAFEFIVKKTDNPDIRAKAMEGLEATRQKMDPRNNRESLLAPEYGLYVERIGQSARTKAPSWL